MSTSVACVETMTIKSILKGRDEGITGTERMRTLRMGISPAWSMIAFPSVPSATAARSLNTVPPLLLPLPDPHVQPPELNPNPQFPHQHSPRANPPIPVKEAPFLSPSKSRTKVNWAEAES
ncbi:hypothetical protein M422DRAFT_255065 [Sphaerobolus stellatus SS14]|uniref:Uncharacterized protein n=1 Tax=Sphaerobolus stellatus (strain SS14) TaxID=990650 RepID=A0A0C9VU72_SPHS4|nr:hypothetical protein M422DRAFT_255065 [Sphaerobolus stellatus SS14]